MVKCVKSFPQKHEHLISDLQLHINSWHDKTEIPELQQQKGKSQMPYWQLIWLFTDLPVHWETLCHKVNWSTKVPVHKASCSKYEIAPLKDLFPRIPMRKEIVENTYAHTQKRGFVGLALAIQLFSMFNI